MKKEFRGRGLAFATRKWIAEGNGWENIVAIEQGQDRVHTLILSQLTLAQRETEEAKEAQLRAERKSEVDTQARLKSESDTVQAKAEIEKRNLLLARLKLGEITLEDIDLDSLLDE